MTADSPFAPDFPQNPLSHLHPMRGKKKNHVQHQIKTIT